LVFAFGIALAVAVSAAEPQPSSAAPSALQMIQSIVKRAIADAPNNFAGIRDDNTADSNMGVDTEISKDFQVSSAIRKLCEACDMGVTNWHKSVDSDSGITKPEYWEFNLGISLGTTSRGDVPASIRKNLSPVIPASFKYAGSHTVDKFDDEVLWNGPNGVLIRVDSMLSGFGPNKRVAVIYVRHTL
jgi:hypothetical protein